MPNTNFYRTRPSKVDLPEAEAGRAVNQCVQSSVVVEFRPLNTYDGEFGFDWLRVTEAEARNIEKSYIRDANNQTAAFVTNNATFGLVQDGYGTAVADLGNAAAQAQIKTEYTTFPISDKGRASESRHLTYYVPYLNLYPRNGLAALQALDAGLTEYAATEPRPDQAELRMIIDIKGQSPESIEIEFDNKDFEITLNDPAAETKTKGDTSCLKIPVKNNYTPTPDTAATSRKLVEGANELKVTITCLRALTSNKEINVYAYHEQDDTADNQQAKEDLKTINELHNEANPGDPNDPTTVILTKRKLAGRLNVLKNNAPEQKELKVLMIKVQTEVTVGTVLTGSFFPAELTKFANVLHQALVHPRIITQLNGSDITLDLSSDDNFKRVLPDNTKPRELNNGYYVYNNGNIHKNQVGFNNYIYDKFINTEVTAADGSKTRPYQNLTRNNGYFLVFIFEDRGNDHGRLFGNVLSDGAGNFIKSVALYKIHADDTATIPHEGLHGLQLRHTHRDRTPLQHPNCRYIFPEGSRATPITSNIMSYNVNADAHSTWKWQWEKIQANV